jgi:hypothetical protein
VCSFISTDQTGHSKIVICGGRGFYKARVDHIDRIAASTQIEIQGLAQIN